MCALTSLTMVKNQYELSRGKSYRQGINDLRSVSNRLAEQVELLFNAVRDLEKEANLMVIIEEQLTDIARKQGVSVDTIVELVSYSLFAVIQWRLGSRDHDFYTRRRRSHALFSGLTLALFTPNL